MKVTITLEGLLAIFESENIPDDVKQKALSAIRAAIEEALSIR